MTSNYTPQPTPPRLPDPGQPEKTSMPLGIKIVVALAGLLVLLGAYGVMTWAPSGHHGAGAAPVVIASPTPAPTSTQTPAVSSTPSEADCRAALVIDYTVGWDSVTDPWPPASRKPVCAGFDRPTLQRLMDEAIDDVAHGRTGP
jgi:hypothetical protein